MTTRNARLRRRREQGASTRRLAHEFHISQTQVVRILNETGGDPLRDATLATVRFVDLEREAARLRDRIAADRRRLRVVLDELEARRTDAILGV